MQGINSGILFNPFFKDWGNGTECTFAAWTKLGGVADAPGACAATLRALTGWADRNLTGLSTPVCWDDQRELHTIFGKRGWDGPVSDTGNSSCLQPTHLRTGLHNLQGSLPGSALVKHKIPCFSLTILLASFSTVTIVITLIIFHKWITQKDNTFQIKVCLGKMRLWMVKSFSPVRSVIQLQTGFGSLRQM